MYRYTVLHEGYQLSPSSSLQGGENKISCSAVIIITTGCSACCCNRRRAVYEWFPLHLVYVRVGMIPAWYLHVLLGYGERLPVLCPHGAV